MTLLDSNMNGLYEVLPSPSLHVYKESINTAVGVVLFARLCLSLSNIVCEMPTVPIIMYERVHV